MDRLKSILEKYSRWQPCSEFINRIEGYRATDFSFCVENAKSLLETIAKEICTQRGQELKSNESIGKLLGLSFHCLGYAKTHTISQIGGSVANIAKEMGNLRTEIGITAHGKTLSELSKRENNITSLTGDFLINATELVSCFLIEAFETDNPIVVPDKLPSLSDNEDFNEYWDSLYGEFEMTEDYAYPASEILFNVDIEAYKTELSAFKLMKNETDNGE